MLEKYINKETINKEVFMLATSSFGGLTGTVTLREGHPDGRVFNVELGKFKELHTVPGTDFSVKGEIDRCAQIFFRVYNKDRAELGYVQLRLVVFQDMKFSWIGDMDQRSVFPKPYFWPDGNFIHLDVVHMQPNDEGVLNQVSRIFLQTVMEFAKEMRVANRIYGSFCYAHPMRFHDLGMKCIVNTQEPEIKERASRGDRSTVGSRTMYVTAKCAENCNQFIAEHPIFPS